MSNDAINLKIKLGMMNQIKALTQRAEAAEAKLAKLAELVPPEGFLESTSDESILTWQRGWDACRAATLRNIEGLNK